jgi:hypothetical protein
MLEYIFCSIYGAYCLSFCVAVAHAIYKEQQIERLERIREYDNLSDIDIRLEMFSEREVKTRLRLEPIMEVDEM